MKIILKNLKPSNRKTIYVSPSLTLVVHRCCTGTNRYDYSKFRYVLSNNNYFSYCEFSKSWKKHI